MPKVKSHIQHAAGGQHHHGSHHHNNDTDMDGVKIKRVKRNKKKVTTTEKIVAGLGVGSTLMGGMGAVKPQAQTTQFVRVQTKQQSGAGTKIKDAIKNIFGIGKAQASTQNLYTDPGSGRTYILNDDGTATDTSSGQTGYLDADGYLTSAPITGNTGGSNTGADTGTGQTHLGTTIYDANGNPIGMTQGVGGGETAGNLGPTQTSPIYDGRSYTDPGSGMIYTLNTDGTATNSMGQTGSLNSAGYLTNIIPNYSPANPATTTPENGGNNTSVKVSVDPLFDGEQLDGATLKQVYPNQNFHPGYIYKFTQAHGWQIAPDLSSGNNGADGTVALSSSNLNSTIYDPSLNDQISNLQLGGATVSQMAPGGVTPGSVLAFMLGLGDGSNGTTSMPGSDGATYKLAGGLWIPYALTDPANDPTSTAPQEGDKGTQQIGNATVNTQFYQNHWVVLDGQTVDGSNVGGDAGFQYGSAHNADGSLKWILMNSQHKTVSAVSYTSNGGVWVADSTTSVPTIDPSLYSQQLQAALSSATFNVQNYQSITNFLNSGVDKLQDTSIIETAQPIFNTIVQQVWATHPTSIDQAASVRDQAKSTVQGLFNSLPFKLDSSRTSQQGYLNQYTLGAIDQWFTTVSAGLTQSASATNTLSGTQGLTTTPDINNSLTGNVTVNGQSMRLSVLPDGRIFDSNGQEVTRTFSAADAATIISAFASAPLASQATSTGTTLTSSNLNSTTYTKSLDSQISSLNLGGATVSQMAPGGVNPGSVLAFMLGLGDGSSTKTMPGADGQTYYLSGGVWTTQAPVTVTPTALTLSNINTVPYDVSLNSQISSLNLNGFTVPDTITPGSVLAFMLGLGSPVQGQTFQGSDGRTYAFDGANFNIKMATPPGGTRTDNGGATGVILTTSNINSITYDGSSGMNSQISTLNLSGSQISQLTSAGVKPGSVLAFMLGLGSSGAAGQNYTGSDGNTYVFSGGSFNIKTVTATPPATVGGVAVTWTGNTGKDSQGNIYTFNPQTGQATLTQAATNNFTPAATWIPVTTGPVTGYLTPSGGVFSNNGQTYTDPGGVTYSYNAATGKVTDSNGGTGTIDSSGYIQGQVTPQNILNPVNMSGYKYVAPAVTTTPISVASSNTVTIPVFGPNVYYSFDGQSNNVMAYLQANAGNLSWLKGSNGGTYSAGIQVGYDSNNNIISYTINGVNYSPLELSQAFVTVAQKLQPLMTGNPASDAAAIGTLSQADQQIYLLAPSALVLPGSTLTNIPGNTGSVIGSPGFGTQGAVYAAPTGAAMTNTANNTVVAGFNDAGYNATTPAQANLALSIVQAAGHPDAKLFDTDANATSGPGALFQINYNGDTRRNWTIVYTDAKTGAQVWVDPNQVLAQTANGGTYKDVAVTPQDSGFAPVAPSALVSSASVTGGPSTATVPASTGTKTTTITGAGVGTTATSIKFTNLSAPDTSTLYVGEQWQLTITGPVGQPVFDQGGIGNNNQAITPYGVIGSSGTLTLTGTITGDEVGNWTENWYVGGQLSGSQLTGSTPMGTLGFTVVKGTRPASTGGIAGTGTIAGVTGSNVGTGPDAGINTGTVVTPSITSLSVSHAPAGATVNITGSNFSSAAFGNAVIFTAANGNTQEISATLSGANALQFVVPSLAAGNYTIKVINLANITQTSNPLSFTIDAASSGSGAKATTGGTGTGTGIAAGTSTGTGTGSGTSTGTGSGTAVQTATLIFGSAAPGWNQNTNTLVMNVGDVQQISASVITNGVIDHGISFVTFSNNILINNTSGVITIVGVAPGVASIVVHPADLPSTNTSQDKIITVNVVAPTSSGNGNGGGGTNTGSGNNGGSNTGGGSSSNTNPTIVVGNGPTGGTGNNGNSNPTIVVGSGSSTGTTGTTTGGTGGTTGGGTGTTTGTSGTTGTTTTINSDGQVIAQLQAQITSLQSTINSLNTRLANQPQGTTTVVGSSDAAQISALQGQVQQLTSLVQSLQSGQVHILGGAVSPLVSGLQMPTSYTNDVSARYANVGGTIYDKTNSHAFATPQEFFGASGLSSFTGLIFDTNWQPSGGQVQGAVITNTASGTYTVKSGDTLWNIAKKYYGDGRQWRTIYEANLNQIPGGPKKLRIGTVLTIPNINQ